VCLRALASLGKGVSEKAAGETTEKRVTNEIRRLFIIKPRRRSNVAPAG